MVQGEIVNKQVFSRHRLPQPYRALLIVFWLLPIVLMITTIAIGHGMSVAFFDPRFLLMIGVLSLPALYIWQEGIDVVEDGIISRIYIPRYYTYAELHTWRLGDQPQRRVLTIWHRTGAKVLECHAVHLTAFGQLKQVLQQHLPYR